MHRAVEMAHPEVGACAPVVAKGRTRDDTQEEAAQSNDGNSLSIIESLLMSGRLSADPNRMLRAVSAPIVRPAER